MSVVRAEVVCPAHNESVLCTYVLSDSEPGQERVLRVGGQVEMVYAAVTPEGEEVTDVRTLSTDDRQIRPRTGNHGSKMRLKLACERASCGYAPIVNELQMRRRLQPALLGARDAGMRLLRVTDIDQENLRPIAVG